ncbi:hypothetical protein [Levilactobacillus suantsaii]|nr:hypothetical protein [Levilactobacillus suantsaii]QMU08412.1 hypothetical protein H3M12_01665 [Levilactobacillus suantsaii]
MKLTQQDLIQLISANRAVTVNQPFNQPGRHNRIILTQCAMRKLGASLR